jgi:hypothetical protein
MFHQSENADQAGDRCYQDSNNVSYIVISRATAVVSMAMWYLLASTTDEMLQAQKLTYHQCQQAGTRKLFETPPKS